MSRVKIGILGCGAVAQVQHLPNLIELDELYDVTVVCDLNPDQAKYVAERTDVDVAEYEPKMNVTPNAVALKDD